MSGFGGGSVSALEPQDYAACLESAECKRFACDIQRCLSKSNYRQERCAREIDRYADCCRRAAAAVRTPSAPKSTECTAAGGAGADAGAGTSTAARI